MPSSRDEMASILERITPEDMGTANLEQWKAACKHGADEAFLKLGSFVGARKSSELAVAFAKAGVEARNAYLKAQNAVG